MKYGLACWLILTASAGPLLAQAKEAKVSAPTRLDWRFAVQGFGSGSAKLAADYDSTKQKYQLFVPKDYQAGKICPLVVFISPGDGPAGLSSWQKICVKEGVLFCSPLKAGNSVPP